MNASLYQTSIASPVGCLNAVASDAGLVALEWPHRTLKFLENRALKSHADHPILKQTRIELEEYFSQNRREFSIPLVFYGSAFQQQVWRALRAIPYGETRSYKHIAEHISNPKACQAVGLALNKNPISILAACHRVVGSSGKLTGYAGGLANKSYLLRLETCSIR